jgi:hypothetical protein
MTDVIDQLIAAPGIYVGSQADPTDGHDSGSVARVEVAVLPGGSGVSMDYEVLSPGGGRVHDEHAVLARSPRGAVLITAHSHADVVTVLDETEPGLFTPGADGSPFPMAIRLEVPEPGHLVYSWSYGRPGEEPAVRDVGTMTLQTH